MSRRGLASPEEPRAQTTDKLLSTLAQFRIINYGMERRQLLVPLPIKGSTTASSGHPFSFTVYRLEPRIPLNTKTLCHQTRPALISTLTLIHLDPHGLRTQEEVHCLIGKWDNLLTFQLACFDTEMLGNEVGYFQVEWWQAEYGGEGSLVSDVCEAILDRLICGTVLCNLNDLLSKSLHHRYQGGPVS
ncbi:hypothetical protein EV421DRAFT_1135186 [Armillaria borealis]|uniref:Uncharacterized protein n=1 Tax=Armillaria borealis TaxID=47425 RepID=A0AA39IEE6_9AGAR|nr:hypothetical protein EV421DRAFT_1135186 [Armillaria borealis]